MDQAILKDKFLRMGSSIELFSDGAVAVYYRDILSEGSPFAGAPMMLLSSLSLSLSGLAGHSWIFRVAIFQLTHDDHVSW